MLNTKIYRDENTDFLKRLVLSKIENLSWRRHGIGCLQAYISEKTDPEIRVHIWHDKAIRENIRNRGDIHNHRFLLESTVLYGNLDHIVYNPFVIESIDDDSRRQKWKLFNVVNYRKDPQARYKLQNILEGSISIDKYHRICEGQKYVFEKGAFHKTIANGLCITYVVKRDQDSNIKANIVAKADFPVIHAFEHPEEFNYTEEILQDAINVLKS